jgi:hypothetical protein
MGSCCTNAKNIRGPGKTKRKEAENRKEENSVGLEVLGPVENNNMNRLDIREGGVLGVGGLEESKSGHEIERREERKNSYMLNSQPNESDNFFFPIIFNRNCTTL